MAYTIIQLDKVEDKVIPTPVRSFYSSKQATAFLEKLAKKQGWRLQKGLIFNRYIDDNLKRVYYITKKRGK